MQTVFRSGRILGGQTARVTKAYDHILGCDDVVQEDWQWQRRRIRRSEPRLARRNVER